MKQFQRNINTQLITQMRVLREQIKARRGGKLITLDVVERVRAERNKELNQRIAHLR